MGRKTGCWATARWLVQLLYQPARSMYDGDRPRFTTMNRDRNDNDDNQRSSSNSSSCLSLFGTKKEPQTNKTTTMMTTITSVFLEALPFTSCWPLHSILLAVHAWLELCRIKPRDSIDALRLSHHSPFHTTPRIYDRVPCRKPWAFYFLRQLIGNKCSSCRDRENGAASFRVYATFSIYYCSAG
jgi:hypothetical protein